MQKLWIFSWTEKTNFNLQRRLKTAKKFPCLTFSFEKHFGTYFRLLIVAQSANAFLLHRSTNFYLSFSRWTFLFFKTETFISVRRQIIYVTTSKCVNHHERMKTIYALCFLIKYKKRLQGGFCSTQFSLERPLLCCGMEYRWWNSGKVRDISRNSGDVLSFDW